MIYNKVSLRVVWLASALNFELVALKSVLVYFDKIFDHMTLDNIRFF